MSGINGLINGSLLHIGCQGVFLLTLDVDVDSKDRFDRVAKPIGDFCRFRPHAEQVRTAGMAEVMDADDGKACLLGVAFVPSANLSLTHRPKAAFKDEATLLGEVIDVWLQNVQDRVVTYRVLRFRRPFLRVARSGFGG